MRKKNLKGVASGRVDIKLAQDILYSLGVLKRIIIKDGNYIKKQRLPKTLS